MDVKLDSLIEKIRKEGIDDAWCKELMDSVNQLTEITGIRINPDDDIR